MKRKTWALVAGAVLAAVIATGGVVVASSAKQATPTQQDMPANTARVETKWSGAAPDHPRPLPAPAP